MFQDKIRIGTMVPAFKDPAGYIRQILPHGFESFSLNWAKAIGTHDPAKIAPEVRKVLEGSDAVVSSLCVYANPLGDDEPAAQARRDWETLIDSCRLFGCDIVAGFTGRVVDKPIDECIARYAEVFGPLAKRAADRGVRLAFENCQMKGNWKTGNHNIAHSPDAWQLMFQAIDSKNVGLQWEPCHQMVALIDPIAQLRKWVGKVFCMHGKDATVMWDVIREHGIHGPAPYVHHRMPGFGDSNWKDIICILRQAGFAGCIDIEGWHDPAYCRDLEMTGQVYALNYLKDCRGGKLVPNPT